MKRALDNFKAVLDLRVNQSDITDSQIKKIIAVIDRAAFDYPTGLITDCRMQRTLHTP